MARMSITGHIRYDDRGDMFIEVPYRKRFIRDLKGCVPAAARSYTPGLNVWRVEARHAGVAAYIMHAHFPHATIGRETRGG
jgi:hypothetical protein